MTAGSGRTRPMRAEPVAVAAFIGDDPRRAAFRLRLWQSAFAHCLLIERTLALRSCGQTAPSRRQGRADEHAEHQVGAGWGRACRAGKPSDPRTRARYAGLRA